jgi:hypothetical protein
MPNDEQRIRLALLELDGWRLTTAPSSGEAHARSRITAPYTLERYFRGSPIREPGETLDQALDAAEWQQKRLDQLSDTPTPVTTGIGSTDD